MVFERISSWGFKEVCNVDGFYFIWYDFYLLCLYFVITLDYLG